MPGWRSTARKQRSKPRALVAIQPLEEANHRRLVPRWPAPATERGPCRRTTRVGKYSRANSASGRQPKPSSCTSILSVRQRAPTSTRAPAPGNRRTSAITAILVVLLVVAVAAAMFEFRERNRARRDARDATVHSLTVEAGARRASAADLRCSWRVKPANCAIRRKHAPRSCPCSRSHQAWPAS